MCLKCKSLQTNVSIHSQFELDNILTLLRNQIALGQIKVTCLFSNKVILNFEDLDKSWQVGMISLKFNCIHCNNEYRLFVDTNQEYLGFFSPLHQEFTQVSKFCGVSNSL